MIFLTVGTQFPFDRLVKSVDGFCSQGLIKDTVFAQIGDSDYRPRNFDFARSLKKADFDQFLNNSSHIISHAGMGTIALAFDAGKPLLVMPRLKKYGEVVNDHQVSIARTFGQVGYLVAVEDETSLASGIQQLASFKPRPRQAQSYAVIRRITRFLDSEFAAEPAEVEIPVENKAD